MFQHPGGGCDLAVWCMPFTAVFFSETKVESQPRFDASRAHLPRDAATVPVHPVFREFKQRFMNFRAHFGYTHPHPFPADGDVVGDPDPRTRRQGGGGGSVSRPKLYPGLLRQTVHHGTLWVLLWMVMMPLAAMHHHPMYRT